MAEETKAPARKRKPAQLKQDERKTNRPVDRPQGSMFESNEDGTYGPYDRYEEVVTNYGRFGVPRGHIMAFKEVQVPGGDVGFTPVFTPDS